VVCATQLLNAYKAKFGKAPTRAVWVNFEPSANVLSVRYQGFKQVFGSAADTISSQPDAATVTSDTQAYLTAHSDTGCIGTGFIVFSEACYKAVQNLNMTNQVLVGAVDVTTDGLTAIQNDQIVGTVWQQPYLQGWYSAMALYQYKQPVSSSVTSPRSFMPEVLYTGSYSVTSSNAAALMADAQAGIA
jgi:ABC-type sugar transport system substrate-binding protein